MNLETGEILDNEGLTLYQNECYRSWLKKYEMPYEKEKLNVAFIAADMFGCGFNRSFLPSYFVQRNSKKYNSVSSIIVCTEIIRWADILVWQRQYRPELYKYFNMARQNGRMQIFETDDNLHALSRTNPSYKTYNSKAPAFELSLAWMRACEEMIVSTQPIKEFYDKIVGYECTVIGNSIDPSRFNLSAKGNHDEIRILWAGSAAHIEDLAVIKGAIKRLKNEIADKMTFTLFGFDGKISVPVDADAAPEYFRKDKIPPGHQLMSVIDLAMPYDRFVPFVGTDEYSQKLADLKCDIGLCPLNKNEFNRYKSNLKWLEYSMVGIATVATDMEPYQCIRHDEDGLLIKDNTEEEWYGAIKSLINDRGKRVRLARNARDRILRDYNMQESWIKYERFFDKAIEELRQNEQRGGPPRFSRRLRGDSAKG
jgi:glycosyltransferase involved in cell wall biosynthesis